MPTHELELHVYILIHANIHRHDFVFARKFETRVGYNMYTYTYTHIRTYTPMHILTYIHTNKQTKHIKVGLNTYTHIHILYLHTYKYLHSCKTAKF